jgi:S1-C subfamily serine protease
MDTKRFRIRAALAAAAGAVLISGAAWHGLAATTQPSALSAAPSAVSQSRSTAVAGGRDSYADVVKNVAPAVVTIRVEGKATAAQPARA